MKQRPYSHSTSRQTSVTIPIGTDSFASYPINFTDPFSPSPNYSSSSGYASPGPGNDFINMFPAPLFGPGSNRTRTSSNASFIEPWSYPSTRSPTSTSSTLPFPYTNGEKSPATHSIGLAISMATSYPTSNIPMPAPPDPMSGYMMFPTPLKTVQQRDEEEQAILFPEQSFGMGIDTYQYTQYLDNYWRLFHPSFPIIHKPTFGGVNESPILKAAMLAIGAQYTDDAAAKAKSRSLHDRCLKLLDQV
jgi:Fungal specific transcription factor domain